MSSGTIGIGNTSIQWSILIYLQVQNYAYRLYYLVCGKDPLSGQFINLTIWRVWRTGRAESIGPEVVPSQEEDAYSQNGGVLVAMAIAKYCVKIRIIKKTTNTTVNLYKIAWKYNYAYTKQHRQSLIL